MSVGWYIHHHGDGHLRRFLAVRPHLEGVVALSSVARPPEVPAAEWVSLPLDAPASSESNPSAGGVLHWAPLGHPGLRSRMARIAAWLERSRTRLLVCDVSVEVALLARLMGVGTVWIAQRGSRRDPPHQLVYCSSRVLAPWSESLATADSGLPAGASYLGALSRYDGLAPVAPPDRREVLVLLGAGGHRVDASAIQAAAQATPSWSWSVAGLGEPVAGRVRDHGRVAETWPLLCAADVVVASAGSNLVAEVAAARRPLVCLPQERPFAEQEDQAGALARAGLAETLAHWPRPDRWPAILERALQRNPERWRELLDGRGAQRLALAITNYERGVGGRDAPDAAATPAAEVTFTAGSACA